MRARALILAASVVLAACGGAAQPAASPSPAAVATGNAVTIKDFSFQPAKLEVKVGTTVAWTNLDSAPHTTTSGAPGAKDGKWDGRLSGSTPFSFTFTTPGTFDYFCSIHPTIKGTVVVK